jgi:hypothetical protein
MYASRGPPTAYHTGESGEPLVGCFGLLAACLSSLHTRYCLPAGAAAVAPACGCALGLPPTLRAALALTLGLAGVPPSPSAGGAATGRAGTALGFGCCCCCCFGCCCFGCCCCCCTLLARQWWLNRACTDENEYGDDSACGSAACGRRPPSSGRPSSGGRRPPSTGGSSGSLCAMPLLLLLLLLLRTDDEEEEGGSVLGDTRRTLSAAVTVRCVAHLAARTPPLPAPEPLKLARLPASHERSDLLEYMVQHSRWN